MDHDDKLRLARDKAEDALKDADEALKDAIKRRIEAGAGSALEELRRFATWVPEFGYGHSQDLCTGEPMTEKERARLRDAPFVCEAFLYPLLGKQEARTFLALFDSVCHALGASGHHDLQQPWYEAKRELHEETLARLTSVVENHKKAGHTLNRDAPCEACVARFTKRGDVYDPTRGCTRTRAVENLAKVKAREEEE